MINTYATLTDYKSFVTARGQTASTDATDDAVIKDLIEQASRYLDGETGRQFYPTVETRLYDIPQDEILYLEADLLEVLSLTNGDGTTIAAADYFLLPANISPRYGIALDTTANVQWESDSAGNTRQVISVQGIWGYCERYATRGWKSGGTLGANISDTTTLNFTMTAGHTLEAGQIVKIGTELYNIDSVATNTITPVQRGDNGSTAATHTSGATVYIWQPDTRAAKAVLDQASIDYDARFGKQDATGAKTATEVKMKGAARSMRDFIDLMVVFS